MNTMNTTKTEAKRYVTPLDLPDDFGCDPFDLTAGEMVCNAARERRVVCDVFGALGGSRVLFLDPGTGLHYDVTMDAWAEWAGEQIWCIENRNGHAGGWEARSPFKNAPEPGAGPGSESVAEAGEPALLFCRVKLEPDPESDSRYIGRAHYHWEGLPTEGSDILEDVGKNWTDDEVRVQVAAQVGITGDEIAKIEVEWV